MSQQGEDERLIPESPPGAPGTRGSFRDVLKRIALTRIPVPNLGISIISRRFLKCFLVAWGAVFILSSLHWRMNEYYGNGNWAWSIGWPLIYGGVNPDGSWCFVWTEALIAICVQAVPAFAVAFLYLVAEKMEKQAAARWPGLLRPADSPDRRRFEGLAGEMILARFGGSIAAAACIIFFYIFCGESWLSLYGLVAESRGDIRLFSAVALFPAALASSIPTALAKRSWRPAALTVLAATGAYVAASAGCVFLPGEDIAGYPLMMPVAQLGAVATAIGVVEGNLERSMATIFAGLFLGPLVGAWAGVCSVLAWGDLDYFMFFRWWHHGMPRDWRVLFIATLASTAVIQTGISLSLALGRRIRNW
jgi:hypothetical protein